MVSSIEINDDMVVIDGVVYRKVDSKPVYCGRKEIAEYLGYKRGNGTVNVSNLYKDIPTVRAEFPNFDMEGCAHGGKPFTMEQIIKWHNIPKKKRIEMYLESKDETE